ncbi:hypothetical protein KC331_g1565 [Hortaea werneckii]|uniref:G-patch domain-containing protein n=1 Tax=Hortaea werneckii TaxID=91943 RepID=A0A3M7C729_HORWE|nr:hypothetical protein KC331_g1565 [Hortaea werneckii]KAI7699183.1 hypothetical protein KC353_g16592 [Hortaea werneckii]RMY47921.1 hypothetical protein D0865_08392 [Hortaea werneckii]
MADEEDDYLSMTFDDPSSKPGKETSLQRTQRLKKEAAERGRVPSKKELAEKEKAARDAALATQLDSSNKGAKMMAKMGFKGGALGKAESARTTPIEVNMKDDRGGIGMDSEKKRKVREAAEQLEDHQKRQKVTEEEYRERTRTEREERRAEGQWWSAIRTLESFETGDTATRTETGTESENQAGEGKAPDSAEVPVDRRPLRSINVLWRPLVKQRREKERERRMRYDLEQSLTSKRDYEDTEAEAENKVALGTEVEELDDQEEDSELDEYEALSFAKRLEKVVKELREKYRYCFWCKCSYPDEAMDGCPGLTEDEHG